MCNDQDDDCDGTADEGIPGHRITCGTGVCTATATQTCEDGDWVGTCTPATLSWSGFLPPINPPNAAGVSSSVFKAGSTVPVKFALTGTSAGITRLSATLEYAKVSNGVVGRYMKAVSNRAPTNSNLFRYDAASRQYVFNWNTKGLRAGNYILSIGTCDGQTRTVIIGLK